MIIVVGFGAALGALLRFAVTNFFQLHGWDRFPWATLLLNLSGAFLLGILAGRGLKAGWYAFLGTGVLGGYTTFSTFQTELFGLLHSGRYVAGVGYFLMSACGFICGLLGMIIGNGQF